MADPIRAALAAAPVGEGPPAVTISALLHPAYEPGDGSADGAQMVGLAWWHPVMGCDSLQIVMDNARNILRSRWGRPVTPPAPLEGEVGKLVTLLAVGSDCRGGVKLSPEQCRRVAALLEQRHPVPVPVSERLPGPEDCDGKGRCWWLIAVCEAWVLGWHFSTVTHWLPATALPLPAAEVRP